MAYDVRMHGISADFFTHFTVLRLEWLGFIIRKRNAGGVGIWKMKRKIKL